MVTLTTLLLLLGPSTSQLPLDNELDNSIQEPRSNNEISNSKLKSNFNQQKFVWKVQFYFLILFKVNGQTIEYKRQNNSKMYLNVKNPNSYLSRCEINHGKR